MLNNWKAGSYFQGFLVLLCFTVFLLSSLWLYVQFADSSFVHQILVLNAKAVGAVCSIFGVDTIVREHVIHSGTISLEIVPECTSLPYLAIFFAGIMAFPTDVRQKFWGILLGVIGLSFLNIIRMISLLLVGMFIPSVFDSAHILVSQSLMIVASVVLWIFWWQRTLSDNGIQP